MLVALLVGGLLLQPATLEEEPPRPFARGSSIGGLVFGLSSGGGETAFTFGGSYGYFVADGVAPGVSTVVTASTGAPTTVELSGFLRVIPWRSYPIAPMLVGKGGRLFIDGFPDLWLVGGGGGLVVFASPR